MIVSDATGVKNSKALIMNLTWTSAPRNDVVIAESAIAFDEYTEGLSASRVRDAHDIQVNAVGYGFSANTAGRSSG